jgi:hypothetical protein
MTIAACYLSAEGVVFGADSTSTMFVSSPSPAHRGSDHHFNFAQKIFQVGESGTLGITMWGLGSLPGKSYRTLIAELSDDLAAAPGSTMQEIAGRWSESFWSEYSTRFHAVLQRTQELMQNPAPTPEEKNELIFFLQTFSGGFCLGGHQLPDRTPQAFELIYSPEMTIPPTPTAQTLGTAKFWGCPNLINRLLFGVDLQILQKIMDSGKWQGTEQELIQIVQPYVLGQPMDLPIREAIDWVHASISATIKTMKFSHLAPVCGGPVEIAVITTDRPFRWVKHKPLHAALESQGF